MKPVVSSFFCCASLALLVIGPAHAKDSAPGPVTATRDADAEEVACIGPGSITGMVVDTSAIITPRFSAYKCGSHYPVQITVQLKDPSATMKVGDTVTLKGSLISVQDAHRGVRGFVLKNAEIAQ
jgi:hypothetical protein